jgi:clan AA aspartic protease (TIGR02281 family)
LALDNGYRQYSQIEAEEDLRFINKLPEYKALMNSWRKKDDEYFQAELSIKKDLSEDSIQTVTIPMKPKGSGTYEVPCKINELPLNLIFDTGASDISISQTEVQFMLKNGYLKTSDITGTQRYIDANGDIELGTTIVFKKVDFGGVLLKNVRASVVNNKNAPLLFGQSALSKYGKITIDNIKKTITISRSSADR